MQVTELEIDGLLLIEPEKREDGRGIFYETYNSVELARRGYRTSFVQDNYIRAYSAGTVYGLEFQSPPFSQAKLIQVLRGAIWDVAVDLRVGSPTFGDHVAFELNSDKGEQLYVPIGFAHGFATLKTDTEVCWKVSALYAPDYECGIDWADEALGVPWPVARESAILSTKDASHPKLSQISSPFVYKERSKEVAAA